jgi:hypothetical protein
MIWSVPELDGFISESGFQESISLREFRKFSRGGKEKTANGIG